MRMRGGTHDDTYTCSAIHEATKKRSGLMLVYLAQRVLRAFAFSRIFRLPSVRKLLIQTTVG